MILIGLNKYETCKIEIVLTRKKIGNKSRKKIIKGMEETWKNKNYFA